MFKDMSRKQTVKHISELLLHVLENLNITNLFAQTYDGCLTMAGALGGVQTLVKEKHPMAEFVYCNAHTLNFVLKNILQTVWSIRVYLQTLNGPHAFFRSAKR